MAMETEPKVRIIIADDHQLIIDGIKSLLFDEEGISVTREVNDGAAAFAAIESNPSAYDLLITDINMPELNGIDLCREVKNNYPMLKVMLLSMHDNPAIIKESIEAEADGYILKNAGKAELIDAIRQIMMHGTYYSQRILPVIMKLVKNEKVMAKYGPLTLREKEILKYIVQEMTSEEIADRLFISKKTVDNHRAHLLEKTGCKSTIGLVKFAILHNYL